MAAADVVVVVDVDDHCRRCSLRRPLRLLLLHFPHNCSRIVDVVEDDVLS